MQLESKRRTRLLRIIIPVILTVIVLSACDFSLFSDETPPPEQTQPPPPADTQPPPPADTQPPPPVDTQPPPTEDIQSPLLGLDYDLDPNFGEITLEAGFSPDPYAIDMVSGGQVDVGALNLGPECLGYATQAPDLRLWWSGEALSGSFRILFEALGGEDTVLIVNNFYGQWQCNDDFDFGTLDPGLDIEDVDGQSARMEIWVASYEAGVGASGTLYISEFELDHDDVP
ncbi:MAG TPA: hypothetical protein G4O08_11145 [Anaerolineae bacterium]|nr:hypothetical protein [Anaerolineae bacterium]